MSLKEARELLSGSTIYGLRQSYSTSSHGMKADFGGLRIDFGGKKICGAGEGDLRGSIREAADRGRLARYLYLERLDVLSLPALGTFGDLELDSLAFLQAAEAARLDG